MFEDFEYDYKHELEEEMCFCKGLIPAMKLWSGRFAKETDCLLADFGDSLPVDQRLWREDIRGSIAHARMLGACGIVSAAEAEAIVGGLEAIAADFAAGRVEIKGEDIHSLIENLLTARIGDVGKKLHTGRSRNDQIALDIRLFIVESAASLRAAILELVEALAAAAGREIDTVLPGYTHLQRAQPVLLAHHLLAYAEMLWRDWERYGDCAKRAGYSPLGAGALAGAGFKLDREMVAAELGLAGITANSLDSVSDRDPVLELTFAAALTQTHMSRLAEELIIWAGSEFGFVEFAEEFSTGSSMMPQKRNPDGAELVRGKTGRVVGDLTALFMMQKGLPLAYNKDLQEDKEALFDAVDTVRASLRLMAAMIPTLKWNRERMRRAVAAGYLNATDLADYLARKGVPFREAHAVVGGLVRLAIERGTALEELPLADLQAASAAIEEDVYQALTVEACLAARDVPGGTAPRRVREALAAVERRLAEAKTESK